MEKKIMSIPFTTQKVVSGNLRLPKDSKPRKIVIEMQKAFITFECSTTEELSTFLIKFIQNGQKLEEDIFSSVKGCTIFGHFVCEGIDYTAFYQEYSD